MIGLLRIKNEARWIRRALLSILPVCDSVLVMDDHSTDGTPDICATVPNVTVFDSPFQGLNETRDKNHLLNMARDHDWVLMIDGDEALEPADVQTVKDATLSPARCYSLKILYLWNSENQVRIDGVYGTFARATMFRPGAYSFAGTSAGGNFHCGNAPLNLQRVVRPLGASLLHFGYMDKEDRIRKYQWYNAKDPDNLMEDRYRHMVQGDIPQIPAPMRLLHAGPLRLETR